jgi:hypothetical protein
MQRRKFSREFTLEAVRLVKDRGVAVAQGEFLVTIFTRPQFVVNLILQFATQRRPNPGLPILTSEEEVVAALSR